jgi:hypothetical protein
MGTLLDAALISFKLTENATGETYQMGFKTGKRSLAANQSALIDAVKAAWTTNISPRTAASTLVAITYSEWGTLGFTGWHQKLAKPYSEASLVGNPLPPQLAIVVSTRYDGDLTIPIRRRRNRIYHGLCTSADMDSAGKVTTTARTAIRDGWKAIGTAAKAVPSDGAVCDGLGVCSVVDGSIFNASVIGVGLGFDTQRRRRQKVVESIAYVST